MVVAPNRRLALFLDGVLVAFVHVLPIGNLPDGLDVVGTNILVLKIVGMLPNVNTEDRDQTWKFNVVM